MTAIDLSEFQVTRPGPTCGIVTLEAALGDEYPTLLAAIAEPAIQGTEISRWAKKRGIALSAYVVNRHRRGDCGCS